MDFSNLSISLMDVLTLGPILILVGVIFYLSNKEMKLSLEKSEEAQEVLRARLTENEQELRDARIARWNELARAAEFGRLSQGLFHDLMSPLTSIVLHTEKLHGSEASSQSIEKAAEASRRMAAYIKDIRSTLHREETERLCILSEELEVVIRFFSFVAREKGIKLEIIRADSCTWTGSPTKLRQLFSNLISNAIDSYDNLKDHPKKKVRISIKQKNPNIITVEDFGCGISKQNLWKIFDPFFTTKSMEKGTGIGLTTVKNIAEKNLRGSIQVKSTVGKGTVVTISYPLAESSGMI